MIINSVDCLFSFYLFPCRCVGISHFYSAARHLVCAFCCFYPNIYHVFEKKNFKKTSKAFVEVLFLEERRNLNCLTKSSKVNLKRRTHCKTRQIFIYSIKMKSVVKTTANFKQENCML